MKKFKFIFIFIFLSGILFTVFQYIPILEEETQSHTNELAKKSNEDDSSGSDDDSEEDVMFTQIKFNFNDVYSKTHPYSKNKVDYKSFFKKINTPPPKI